MIWFDWFAERRLSVDELRRALATVMGCGYDDVVVIDDISATRKRLPGIHGGAIGTRSGYLIDGPAGAKRANDQSHARIWRRAGRPALDANQNFTRIVRRRKVGKPRT